MTIKKIEKKNEDVKRVVKAQKNFELNLFLIRLKF